MTIKNFKVGQTAYILEDGRQEARFYEPANSTTHLVEDRDYGAKRLLFLTAEAVAEHKELIDLQDWVQEATHWPKVKRYTLTQLREVKKILEGEEDT